MVETYLPRIIREADWNLFSLLPRTERNNLKNKLSLSMQIFLNYFYLCLRIGSHASFKARD
jgi:hypothetical protein